MRNGLVIMPVIDCWDFTIGAVRDCAVQLGGDVEILVVNQGSTSAVRRDLEGLEELFRTANRGREVTVPTVRVVTHDPPLPSLAATWNRTLEYAWACGHLDALVVNNDIQLRPWTYQGLRDAAQHYRLDLATPVNVKDRYDPAAPCEDWRREDDEILGGPDFSCFLITPRLNLAIPFDEGFAPAYHEDCDLVRRAWLTNQATTDGGSWRLAGLPIGYFHAGSATINRSPEARAKWHAQFERCRARYVEKWGGLPHHETYLEPFTHTPGDTLLTNLGTPGGAIL